MGVKSLDEISEDNIEHDEYTDFTGFYHNNISVGYMPFETDEDVFPGDVVWGFDSGEGYIDNIFVGTKKEFEEYLYDEEYDDVDKKIKLIVK